MRVHIDWLTYTMPMIYPSHLTGEETHADAYAATIGSAFLRTFGAAVTAKAFGGVWTQAERSRAPYTDAWRMGDGITVYASPNLVHMCVEISGTGCEALIAAGMMESVLKCVHERVTRIDIACDVETSVTPPQFVAARIGKRMQSSGYQKSSRGETCYVGSQKSDRYARVYRYAKPHPRSHLLRIEHVFRKDYAKSVAKACLDGSLESVALACKKSFGWGHAEFNPAASDAASLSKVGRERLGGNTVTWLITAAAPAFRRLVQDGTIKDPIEFFTQHFLEGGLGD